MQCSNFWVILIAKQYENVCTYIYIRICDNLKPKLAKKKRKQKRHRNGFNKYFVLFFGMHLTEDKKFITPASFVF